MAYKLEQDYEDSDEDEPLPGEPAPPIKRRKLESVGVVKRKPGRPPKIKTEPGTPTAPSPGPAPRGRRASPKTPAVPGLPSPLLAAATPTGRPASPVPLDRSAGSSGGRGGSSGRGRKRSAPASPLSLTPLERPAPPPPPPAAVADPETAPDADAEARLSDPANEAATRPYRELLALCLRVPLEVITLDHVRALTQALIKADAAAAAAGLPASPVRP